jgi:hypothetical protein
MFHGKHVSDQRIAPSPYGGYSRIHIAISASGNTDRTPTLSGEFTNYVVTQGKQGGLRGGL